MALADGSGWKPGAIAGPAFVYRERAYKKADSDMFPFPLVMAQYKWFYIDRDVGGFYLVDKKHFQFSVVGGASLGGYHSSESPDLSGMEDRQQGPEAGLRVNVNTPVADLTVTGLNDIAGFSDGRHVEAYVSKTFFDALVPRAGAEWFSRKMTDYYYGVRDTEATVTRPMYYPDQTVNYFAGVMFGIPLGKRWALAMDVQYTLLSDEIRDSPIVAKDFLMRYEAGVVYRF